MRTYGLESEKVVSGVATHEPHLMSQAVFTKLGNAAVDRGQQVSLHQSDMRPDAALGIISPDLGEQGVDNSYNLQETAFPPTDNLTSLASLATLDVHLVKDALAAEGATIINMSNHPLGRTDEQAYATSVAPKSLYDYLRFRGWDHAAGIDAKAQNSPTTSVSAYEAADAVSTMIGAGAASIGIFGNSPFAEGELTGLKESRLAMWDRMMSGSTVEGDRRVAQFPQHRFRTMAQYFNWMFGGNTGIHFVLSEGQDYKTLGDRLLIVEGNPAVLDYLEKPAWEARYLRDILSGSPDSAQTVRPSVAHMTTMQFAQFTGARIRYELDQDRFPLEEFLKACKNPSAPDVERLFDEYATNLYIEGRDPGSNFPDKEIQDAGADIARSVMMAPSAIQAGLIRNLSEAAAYVDSFDWQQLGRLRDAAIKDGLSGAVDNLTVRQFAEGILEVASRGLSEDEQWMLAYPRWVLETGKNGADRAIEYVRRSRLNGREAIAKLVESREVKL